MRVHSAAMSLRNVLAGAVAVAIVALAIDKKRRRPVYAASHAALEILSNPGCVNARSDFPN